jgi:ABC-type Fe3+-hydroxamate transport system substrate-binding protein
MRSPSPKAVCLVIALCAVSLDSFGCRRQAVSGGRASGAPERPLWRGVPQHNLSRECVANFNQAIDYFPDKVTPQYAQIFSVSYHGNYKVVRLAARHTAQENEPMSDVMVLTQCGTPAPRLEGSLAGASVIEIPIRTIASNDNCDVAAICELGFGERLVAVGGREVYNPDIRRRWEAKQLASIGFGWHAPPNLEIALALRPDALFMRRASLTQGEALAAARRLGVKAAPTLARSEKSYLGYAEWMKFFALFLNAEREAEAKFADVARQCETIKQRAQSAATKPKAVWANYESGGFWRVARGPLDMRTHYLADAGALNPLFDESALPVARLSNEQFVALAADADVWITESVNTQGWPDESFLRRFKAWRNQRVYHHQKKTDFTIPAYDWYETGVVRPDLALADLLSLFHHGLLPGHELMFFDLVTRGAN